MTGRYEVAYRAGYDPVVERGPLSLSWMRVLSALNDERAHSAYLAGNERAEAFFAGYRDGFDFLIGQVELYEEEAP